MENHTAKSTKRTPIWVAIIVLFLLVAAGLWLYQWSSSDHDVVDVSPTDGSTPVIDEQGNVSKELGEFGALYDTNDTAVFEISVTDAEYSYTCPSRISDESLDADNGSFLFLTVEAALAEELPAELELEEHDDFMPLMPENFVLHSPDGSKLEDFETIVAYECFDDDELLPSFISAGQEVSGLIVFDVSEQVQTVSYLLNDDPGWNWSVQPRDPE